MRALDKALNQKGGHMEVLILITAFASAGAFIGRIVKLNLEEEF
jgi:hypothetical protein